MTNTQITNWTSYLPSNSPDYRAWAGTGPNADAVYALYEASYSDPMHAFRDAVEAAVVAAEAPVDVESIAAEALRSYGPHLYDARTAEDLGPATSEQIAASDEAYAKDGSGGFLIDADGDVVADGSWGAQQPGVRTVYTEVA